MEWLASILAANKTPRYYVELLEALTRVRVSLVPSPLGLIAPGEMPLNRLKARLNAASDWYPRRLESSARVTLSSFSQVRARCIRQRAM